MQAKGDLDGAIQKYNEAIAKAPANQVSAFKQALASAQLAEATPLMDQAVAKHSGGDPAGAIPLYEKGLSIYPNNPHGYTNLAGAYQAIDDFNKAKANYSKAIELDAKNESDNWYFIGLIDENFGQAAAAMGDYGKYLAAKATGSYAADAKTRIARLKTNPASCQKLSTSAQVKASAQASGAFNDAVALQQANKYDEAIAKYNEAITSTPNEPSYYYSLGTCYQAKEGLLSQSQRTGLQASDNPAESGQSCTSG
jgi:tetratricopeptide (TPR) repeat protein